MRVICFSFALFVAASAQAKPQIIERIIAIVDDRIVLLSEVETVVEDMMRAEPPPNGIDKKAFRQARRKEVLDTLIAEKLIEAEIKKLRIEVADQEIEALIAQTKEQYGLDDEKLVRALAQQGLSMKEYREGLTKQMMKAKIIQLKVKSRVAVSDDDVKNIMTTKQGQAVKDFQVRARHILFIVKADEDDEAAKKKADAAHERAIQGEDFAKLATELSEGPTGKNGGDLGYFGKGEMVPAFERVAYQLKDGEISPPVKSSFGWHIIKVEGRKEVEKSGNVKDQLRQQLYEEELERVFNNYIEDLRKHAYIEVRQ